MHTRNSRFPTPNLPRIRLAAWGLEVGRWGLTSPGLDNKERPTSGLHLTRVTLSLRQLGAEPHTKEVGRAEVYNHHCLRSARGHDGRRDLTAGSPDVCAAVPHVRQSD